MHIGFIPYTFDPTPLLAELAEHPEVWNEITHRTAHPNSPHREVSDIWVRYNDLKNFNGNMARFNGPHKSVWYPVSEKLPSVKALSEELAEALEAECLGGILITKVPAYKQVYPHADSGWHAGFYQKVGMQLAGNEDQAFCFDDGELSAMPGETYWFDNHVRHWVRNDSSEDRITLIVTLKWEQPTCH